MRRLTTAALLLASSFATTACIEGYDTRDPRQDGGMDDDDGSSIREEDCKIVDRGEEVVVINSASDFDDIVPRGAGCWDLYGTLRIEGPAITSVADLGKLRSVDHLELVDTGLTSWDTEDRVVVCASLFVDGNDNLTTFSNLALERWPDNTVRELSLTLTDNDSLTDLGTLAYTKELDGDLRIEGNRVLSTISLGELKVVKGEVEVAKNDALTSLDLDSLESVDGNLTLRMNLKLESFAASELQEVENINLMTNPKLRTIDPFTDLMSVGVVTIDDNDALQSLAGLAYVNLATQLVIRGNAQLSDVSGVYGWTGIALGGSVTDNPALSSCKVAAIASCTRSNIVNERNATDSGTCPPVACQ